MDDSANEFSIINATKETIKTASVERRANENAPFGVILRWENTIDSEYFCFSPFVGFMGKIFSDIPHSLS